MPCKPYAAYMARTKPNFTKCSSRKYPYSPHRGDWNFLRGGGSVRPKNLKKCTKLNWNFQRSEGGLRKHPFCGGGMDIFWNNTIFVSVLGTLSSLGLKILQCLDYAFVTIFLHRNVPFAMFFSYGGLEHYYYYSSTIVISPICVLNMPSVPLPDSSIQGTIDFWLLYVAPCLIFSCNFINF